MDDDFNTGGAVAVLFDVCRLCNRFIDAEKLEANKETAKLDELQRATTIFRELAKILGLFREPPQQAASGVDDGLVDGLMQLVIDIRAAARKNKDFATADKIRDTLKELGLVLEDRPDGTGWSRG